MMYRSVLIIETKNMNLLLKNFCTTDQMIFYIFAYISYAVQIDAFFATTSKLKTSQRKYSAHWFSIEALGNCVHNLLISKTSFSCLFLNGSNNNKIPRRQIRAIRSKLQYFLHVFFPLNVRLHWPAAVSHFLSVVIRFNRKERFSLETNFSFNFSNVSMYQS